MIMDCKDMTRFAHWWKGSESKSNWNEIQHEFFNYLNNKNSKDIKVIIRLKDWRCILIDLEKIYKRDYDEFEVIGVIDKEYMFL